MALRGWGVSASSKYDDDEGAVTGDDSAAPSLSAAEFVVAGTFAADTLGSFWVSPSTAPSPRATGIVATPAVTAAVAGVLSADWAAAGRDTFGRGAARLAAELDCDDELPAGRLSLSLDFDTLPFPCLSGHSAWQQARTLYFRRPGLRSLGRRDAVVMFMQSVAVIEGKGSTADTTCQVTSKRRGD